MTVDPERGLAPPLRLQRRFELLHPHGSRLAFAPDGRRWAVATGGGRIHLLEGDRLEATVDADEAARDLRWRDDGGALLLGNAEYDLVHGRCTGTAPPDPDFNVSAAAAASDGGDLLLATTYITAREEEDDGEDDYAGPRERLLLLHGPDRIRTTVLYEGHDELPCLAVGARHVAAADTTIHVWERASGRALAELVHHRVVVRVIGFDDVNDRLYAAAADGTLSVWDTTCWQRVAAWQAHGEDIAALAVHPGRLLLATGSNDETLRVWSAEQPGRLLYSEALDGRVEAVAWTPAGDRLAVAVRSFPARLLVYDVPPGPAPSG